MSWPIVKLGEIFDIARGGSPRPIQNYITEDPEGLNWIMIGDTKGDSKYIERVAKKIKKEGLGKTRQVQPGDFLLTNSMSFGRPYILKTSGCIHDGWLVLRPKSDNLHTDYFYYCLSSDVIYQKLSAKAAGAVVKNLNTAIVKELEVPLPPLPIQKQIAVLLEKADTLRSQCKQMEQELNQLAQSVFLEVFGDPVTNPKGWIKDPLGNSIIDAQNGMSRRSALGEAQKEVVLRLQDIRVNEVRLEAPNLMALTVKEKEKYKVYAGDLLFIRVNGNKEYVGRCAVWKDDNSDVYHNDHIIKIKFSDNYLPDFLSFIFNNRYGKHELNKQIKTSAGQYTISQDGIEKLRIIRPPMHEQNKFVMVLKEISERKRKLNAQFLEHESLFNALMQSAFNGKLNLTKAA